jgi:predicted phosphodiesterase
MQTFSVELNYRDQMKMARRLIAQALRTWAPGFDQVIVAAVGGNHGENRLDGKAFTSFSDNADVAIFETLEEVFAENPDAFSHMSFVIPDDRLDLTLDVKGTITALAHGHQAGKGSTAAQKLDNWWMGQAHGMQPAGDASLLLSGHFHHLSVTQSGQKTHIQCPALEGGSDWWRNVTGQRSAPGLLTLTIGSEHIREDHRVGWDNLQVV